ncbi:MAG TPA: efflux RND transporter periplasmic adaptor subunit [Steroidobacteraceae bacterium]|nr:efflux RND transporter periplasmic adaptor subunit [Steroidobacteraceae bacterium]
MSGRSARSAILFAMTCAALLAAACSHEESSSGTQSVLVEETPLRKGSLPSVVTVFGMVQGSTASRQTLMAPTAAVVADIPVRVGESVGKDTPLIRLAPTPQTAASYAQARSALAVATQLAERTRQMLSQHLATRQQLAEAQKTQSDARTALAALEAQGAGGANTLRAPFRAVVTALSTVRGAVVSEGAPLLEIAGADDLVVHAGTVPSTASAIARGNRALVLSVDGKRSVQGHVVLRGAAVESATGLTPIDIAIPQGSLQPGEMAEARITTGLASGYLIPHEAVLVDDSGNPYVVQDVKGAAKKVSIRLLASEGARDLIDGELDAEASLVLAGNYQLEEGMKIRVEQRAQPPGAAQPVESAQPVGSAQPAASAQRSSGATSQSAGAQQGAAAR